VATRETATFRARLADGSLAGQWRLDPGRSTVELHSKSMWGLASVRGSFKQLSGEGALTAAGEVSGTLAVQSASIDTKNRRRDDHLRSADFFDSAAYSDIVFTAQRATPSDTGATVHGTLRVRDQSRPLSLPVTVSTSGAAIQVDAQVAIDRSDFGLTWNMLGMAAMTNTITIHAVFVRG
jgi:polyisoprenoid-binding protein YceI